MTPSHQNFSSDTTTPTTGETKSTTPTTEVTTPTTGVASSAESTTQAEPTPHIPTENNSLHNAPTNVPTEAVPTQDTNNEIEENDNTMMHNNFGGAEGNGLKNGLSNSLESLHESHKPNDNEEDAGAEDETAHTATMKKIIVQNTRHECYSTNEHSANRNK